LKNIILYVGATSIYPNIELLDLNVSTSLVSVSFNRNKLEKIRRSRNISVNSMAAKIGLSRSRYYRWLDSEIDLPYDLLIGIQKMLVLTDLEMHELFGQPGDEIIQKTTLLAYYALKLSRDDSHRLRDSLIKHRNTTMKNDPYLLLMSFSELCVLYVDSDDLRLCLDAFTEVMDIIFMRDMWTTIDIIILISMVYMDPKKFSALLPEIYKNICQPSIYLSLNQQVSFLYDLLCIAITLKKDQLILDILEKLNSFDPSVDDWKSQSICQLSHIILNHWQDKKIFDNAFNNLLSTVNAFGSLDYEQKMYQLISSYRDYQSPAV
jgi:transcriptional regulator with XRE-family HTH domain